MVHPVTSGQKYYVFLAIQQVETLPDTYYKQGWIS